ncbi:riboflavin synthase [Candidatus Margulisiibacteriota bacterium]
MFTGIIEDTGKIKKLVRKKDRQMVVVYSKELSLELKIGDSVAVNGVCLTVTNRVMRDFEAEVVPETMSKTTLGSLKVGDLVNLERAMKMEGRFDGHVVTGHIDCRSTILEINSDSKGLIFEIVIPASFSKYIIDKGSISVDGVSLTIAKVKKGSFGVAVIPHTFNRTNLRHKKAGDLVNLEFDVLGKYVEKMLGSKAENLSAVSGKGIDWDFLKKAGLVN